MSISTHHMCTGREADGQKGGGQTGRGWTGKRSDRCTGDLVNERTSLWTKVVFTQARKTLHVVAVASDGDLKRWEDFY
jgi:hypothetical protein